MKNKIMFLILIALVKVLFGQQSNLIEINKVTHDAEVALEKGIRFYHSISIKGGYVYNYTLDMKEKWGEGLTDDFTIEVQPPGTPAVGMAFLRVFQVSGNSESLEAAKDAAYALITGQNDLGGWEHKIYFDRPKSTRVSFDDDQTQSAIRFLMALDQVIENKKVTHAVNKALDMMLISQLKSGGWPHKFPEQGNYHDFATFNDQGINDCIKVMIDAHRYYRDKKYQESLNRAGRFMNISQLPPPQPGWAQQYNQFLQPAWARSFEPPSVCSSVTLNNINSLIDLYLYTNSNEYLEPIPDALRWLNEIQLENGKWPRFVELGTGKPLYYDRGRIRVQSIEELHIERRAGYGYQVNLRDRLKNTTHRFERVEKLKAIKYKKNQNRQLTKEEYQKKIVDLLPHMKTILADLDEQGRWITCNDRFKKHVPGKRWNGEYRVADRISSAVFIRNVNALCDFRELVEKLRVKNE